MANEACTDGCPTCGQCCAEVVGLHFGREETQVRFRCTSCEHIWQAELMEGT